jgi:rhodanese-related sulfurtransferase
MAVRSIPTIDCADASSGDRLLLDVRNGDEWNAGHAPHAVHIPLDALPERTSELDPGRAIVCLCRSGNRSGQATALLRECGFDAVNMAGGMRAWAAAGLPVVDAEGRTGSVI